MKKIFLLFICIAQLVGAYAQIKMADAAYKEQMTASKTINEPLSLDNNFYTYNGTYRNGYDNTNIVGDTLYTNGADIYCYVVNHTEKVVKSLDRTTNKFQAKPIPQGYYRVTGIFIGADAGGIDMVNELYALIDSGYKTNFTQSRKEWIERMPIYYEKMSKINESLHNAISRGEKCYLPQVIDYRLESLDSSRVYYININQYNRHHFLPVKFYNFICNELKDKNVYLYNTHWQKGLGMKITDDLTKETIFLKDSLFHCVDIVLNDGLDVCCVLEGEKTGKFAIEVGDLKEGTNRGFSYFITPSGKITIWRPPHHMIKGTDNLIRNRFFDAPTGKEMIIIKVDDLNAIYAETKRHKALTAAQRKLTAEKQNAERKAREAKRKQELRTRYGNEFGNLIANSKVALGMTPEMCRQAWGTPLQMFNTIDATGKYTVWKYNFKTCIYFYNGKVIKITN